MKTDEITQKLKPIFDHIRINKEVAGQNGSYAGSREASSNERLLNWVITLLAEDTPDPRVRFDEGVQRLISSETSTTVRNNDDDQGKDGLTILRTAIERALKCTPHAVVSYLSDEMVAHVTYDCGDPWDILNHALEDYKTSLKDGGGQDRKYKFEDGHFINRVSGEVIPHDEPTVIFRGRDYHALAMLKDYLFMSDDDHHKQAINDRIAEFEKFAMEHPERMKEPGISRHMELNSDFVEPTKLPSES